MFKYILVIAFSVLCSSSVAQKLTQRTVSFSANRSEIAKVLNGIGEKGGFYFSYDPRIVPTDSLVTLAVRDKTVQEVLFLLFQNRYNYKELGNHLIIQKAAAEKYSVVTGTVTDSVLNEAAEYVSVYSKTLLAASITDEAGRFRLRFKERDLPQQITFSKLGYWDTTIAVTGGTAVNIALRQKIIELDEVLIHKELENNNFLTRWFVPLNLRMHSRNISRFFVYTPYQLSFVPGLGTQGKMATQSVNKFSVNVLGAYTKGTSGLEMAGMFNINQNHAKYVQAAGLFNLVFGNSEGLQMAGLYNHVGDSLKGIQGAGIVNIAEKYAKGIQMAGVMNLTKGNLIGIQASSIYNEALNVKGLQASAIVNVAEETVNGVQISAIINRAKVVKGVQIGLINKADSSSGYSFGLVNLIKKGNSGLSIFSDGFMPVNLAWKTGTPKFYTIFLLGSGLSSTRKRFSFGYGIGKEILLKQPLSILAEFTSSTVYLGDIKNSPNLYRLSALANYRVSPSFSVFAGPQLAAFSRKDTIVKEGYELPENRVLSLNAKSAFPLSLGLQMGISWNYTKTFTKI